MEPLIRMEGIKKVFYTDEVETHALADVHLEIRPGEYIAIAGPSGCGKTTLLSILGLLDTPTDGTYMLSGEHVAKLSAADRARIRNRQIGFIFQAFNLIGDLTVYENVELPLTYRGMSSQERKKRVADALERVQMGHRMKHYPSQQEDPSGRRLDDFFQSAQRNDGTGRRLFFGVSERAGTLEWPHERGTGDRR